MNCYSMDKTNKGGPGNPLKVTKADRRKVMLLCAAGFSERAIANVLGTTQVTVRKHFAEELETGRAQIQAENLSRLDRAAAKGNVSAMKYLDGKLAAAKASGGEKAEPLGKKEAANLEAQTAHEETSWGHLVN